MGIPQFNTTIDSSGLPIVPKESDLWKNEKSLYRNWIIFSICAIVIFIAALVTFIAMSFLWKDISFSNFLAKINGDPNYVNNAPAYQAIYENAYTGYYIIFPIIVLVGLCLLFAIYIMSIFKSYKSKTFRFLFTYQNYVLVLFGIVGIFLGTWNGSLSFYPGSTYIFFIIICVFSIAMYIYPLRKIHKFRNEFNISFLVERTKEDMLKNPNAYNQGMNNPFGGGMFGNMFGGGMFGGNPYVNQPNNPNPTPPPNASNAEFKESPADESQQQKKPIKDQFDDMSTDQLKEIASKLLVSGSEIMTRQELLKRIRELMDQQKQDEFGQKK